MRIEAAKATAKWWRERITRLHHDNGDNSQSSQMAGMLADLLAADNKPTVEQLDKFEEALTEMLSKENVVQANLHCDYAPCGILSEAAAIARIDSSVFPWKVHTFTTDKTLSVTDGYGQPCDEFIIK